MFSGKEAWHAPQHASPAELTGRVFEDGRRDGHALEDVLELRAGSDGRVGGRYGLDEAGGPGGVGGEVEELGRRVRYEKTRLEERGGKWNLRFS